MRLFLPSLICLLSFALSSQGAAVGDVQLGVKSEEGPLTPVWITKTAGKVIGWNGSGDLGPITVSTAFSDLTGKPTTLAGYGISDSITAALAASTYEPIITTGSLALSKLATNPLARANHTGTQAWSTITSTPTTLSGYGITDAESPLTFSTGLTRIGNTITVDAAQAITRLTALGINGFVKTSGGNGTLSIDTSTYEPTITTGSLALSKLATNPLARSNHTGTQAWSTITGTPTTLSGYGITDAASPMQAETLAYYQRIITAGGDIDAATLAAVDELIVSAKRDGWWSSVKEAYLFCGTNMAAALCKLVTPSGVATSLTNHNFVTADYSQSRGFGIETGNNGYGASDLKWLDTGFLPASHGMARDNACLIASSTSNKVASVDSSGLLISNYIDGNADYPNLFYNHHGSTMSAGTQTFTWQTLAPAAKVVGISFGTGGSVVSISADGIPLESWTGAGSGTGTLSGEIRLWKSYLVGSPRTCNGMLGSVFIGSDLTPLKMKLATAAVAKFERKIRSAYGVPEMFAWGDSITAHQGITAGSRMAFCDQTARKLGLREWNMGSLSQHLATTLPQLSAVDQLPDVLALAPQTVMLMYGTNDGQLGTSHTTYATALNTVVSALIVSGRRVILCTPCYSTHATYNTTLQRQYAVKCAAAAIAYGCIFADTNRAIADRPTPTDYMADANHPNDAGHMAMGQCVAAAVNGRQERKLTLDLGSAAAGATGTQTVEVLTARVGQAVQLSLPATVDAGLVYSARVTADDTVTISYLNTTGSSIDPASAEYSVSVSQ